MTSAAVTPDATRCPLCGQANACAMEIERETGVKQAPCWCTQVDFSPELLGRLPPQARGKACICASCARTSSG
jgi:hypothetical protein